MGEVVPITDPRPAPSLVAWGSIVAPRAPEPDSTPPEGGSELTGHLGLATVAVVIFHVYQYCNVNHFLYAGSPRYTILNSLDAAVPWLFVIVAFVLFEPIARSAIDGGPSMPIGRVIARRAARLIPVYYVAILVVWFPRQQTLPGDWRDLLEHLTFTQVFDEKRIFYTIGPAWAVSVAALFFLTLALLSVALTHGCRRLEHRKDRVLLVAGTICALSALSIAWKAWSFGVQHRYTGGSFTTWFGPAANLDNFGAGMAVALIAVVLGDTRRLSSRARLTLRIAAVALVVTAFAARHAGSWTTVYFSTLCSLGFGCFVAAAVLGPRRKDRWAEALSSKPLHLLGLISLSLYLWHEPVMLALEPRGIAHQAPDAFVQDLVVVTIFSLAVAALSYRAVERPTLKVLRIAEASGAARR